jgi:hypothetical protein
MIYEIATTLGFIAAGTLGWMWNQSRQNYALLEARALQLQEYCTQEQTLRSKIQTDLENTQK